MAHTIVVRKLGPPANPNARLTIAATVKAQSGRQSIHVPEQYRCRRPSRARSRNFEGKSAWPVTWCHNLLQDVARYETVRVRRLQPLDNPQPLVEIGFAAARYSVHGVWMNPKSPSRPDWYTAPMTPPPKAWP
jgi:hypothetical protein